MLQLKTSIRTAQLPVQGRLHRAGRTTPVNLVRRELRGVLKAFQVARVGFVEGVKLKGVVSYLGGSMAVF